MPCKVQLNLTKDKDKLVVSDASSKLILLLLRIVSSNNCELMNNFRLSNYQ